MSNCNCSPSPAACDVIAERERQKTLSFGGVPSVEFDKSNGQADWITFITAYAGNAGPRLANGVEFRRSMVKVAALAIAAIENFDAGNCP
jgi:hypothetical protein